jgi:DUF1365 family protein
MQRGMVFGVNRPGLMSFYLRDHGRRDGSSISDWITGLFSEYGIKTSAENVILVTLPRVLGYVFNPVSFWFAISENGCSIRAVLCEVNNTFKETHSYLCLSQAGGSLDQDRWLSAEKLFHVSPFLRREGYYKFRFRLSKESLGVCIDYYNEENEKMLITELGGSLEPFTARAVTKYFFGIPLLTFKVLFLIHWQALKLFAKRIRYIPKPEQLDAKTSGTLENVIVTGEKDV